jgi:hypothetical protein
MKYWLWMLVALVLAGCAGLSMEQSAKPEAAGSSGELVTAEVSAVQLEDYGPAPEWQNEIWLNTDAPLPLEELRGKVVLLEMWTFG